LARKLKVTAGYLSLVEQDKREPSLGFLSRVGEYFDVPVGFLLLFGTDDLRATAEHRKLIQQIEHATLSYFIHRPPRPIGRPGKAKRK